MCLQQVLPEELLRRIWREVEWAFLVGSSVELVKNVRTCISKWHSDFVVKSKKKSCTRTHQPCLCADMNQMRSDANLILPWPPLRMILLGTNMPSRGVAPKDLERNAVLFGGFWRGPVFRVESGWVSDMQT